MMILSPCRNGISAGGSDGADADTDVGLNDAEDDIGGPRRLAPIRLLRIVEEFWRIET